MYYPYLLINKKRYAGLYWTNPDKHDKMDAKVRRRENPETIVTRGARRERELCASRESFPVLLLLCVCAQCRV